MPSPALCPGHASPRAFPPTGRLPSTLSAPGLSADVVRGFAGTMQPSDSSPLPSRLRFLSFPTGPGIAVATAGGMRSPRFRRIPFRSDLVSDSGGASAPRVTAPHMLPSALWSASASATLSFSELNTDPSRWLCTLRRHRRRCRRNTRYQAARYGLTWAGLAPAGTRQLRLAHPVLLLPSACSDCWCGPSCRAGRSIVVGLDDTLERRRGAKIAAKGIYRDPVRSSQAHFVKASG